MKYRRSIVLIDKRFQVRFSFYVCSWLFALSVVYPIIVYNLFTYCQRFVAEDPLGPALEKIQESRQEVLLLLVSFHAIFLLITFLISIFLSHRIAGPLFKLRQKFREVKRGSLTPDLAFRKADHFQLLATEFNEMLAALADRVDERSAQLAAVSSKIEAALSSTSLGAENRKSLEAALSELKASQRLFTK